MKALNNNGLLSAIGGLCAFIVVMGIGRFAYTVLLPGMMQTYGFDEETAGVMAAWNFGGYLLGVLLMRKETPGLRRYALLLVFLMVSLASSAAMGLARTIPLWHAIRFVAGIASGAAFVLCSAIVLDTLAALKQQVLAGLLFCGVGGGIALGGILAGPLQAAGGPDTGWVGMALLGLPLAVIAGVTLRPAVNHARPEAVSIPDKAAGAGNRRGFTILLIAYFIEGFGYIVGATFLVTLVQSTSHSAEIARVAWVVTGIMAAVSPPFWQYVARKRPLPVLVIAFVLQGIGALIPVLFHTLAAAMAAGVLLGGTFMGITVMSLQLGVSLSAKPSAHTVAVMTSLYGIGQILGPFCAGYLASGSGLSFAFILSSASLFIAAGLLLVAMLAGPRK